MAGKRGRPPHTEERGDSVKSLEAIIEKLGQVSPPRFVQSELEQFCAKVLESEKRRLMVRALVYSVIGDNNPYKITKDALANLFASGAWPKQLPAVTGATINNFAARAKDPADNLNVGSYLMLLSLLYRHNHPCFQHVTSAALVQVCEPLFSFEILTGRAQPRSDLQRQDILRMGLSFHQVLSMGERTLSSASFAKILEAGPLHGLEPIRDDAELKNSAKSLTFTAIRLSPDQCYVASKVSFTRVQTDPESASPQTAIYVRTWMRQKGSRAAPQVRSHGFVIPGTPDIYLAQYHRDLAGLNIAAFAESELSDNLRPFWRGLILALDRDKNEGALASRIVLLRRPASVSLPQSGPGTSAGFEPGENTLAKPTGQPADPEKPDALLGTLTRRQLIKALDDEDLGSADILEYLHDGPQVALRPIEETNSGATDLSTWGAIQSYLTRDDIQKLLKASDHGTARIETFYPGPLLAR